MEGWVAGARIAADGGAGGASYHREHVPAVASARVPYPSERAVTVSVVIPALNEAANLPHVFGRLPRGWTR